MGGKAFEEIRAEKCPNLMKAINTQIQEVQCTTCARTMARRILNKLVKTSDRESLKSSQRKRNMLCTKERR